MPVVDVDAGGSGPQSATPALDRLEARMAHDAWLAEQAGIEVERGGGLIRINKLGRLAHKRSVAQRKDEEALFRMSLKTATRASSVLSSSFHGTYGLDSVAYGQIGAAVDEAGLFSVVAFARNDVPYGFPLPADYQQRLRPYTRHAADVIPLTEDLPPRRVEGQFSYNDWLSQPLGVVAPSQQRSTPSQRSNQRSNPSEAKGL